MVQLSSSFGSSSRLDGREVGDTKPMIGGVHKLAQTLSLQINKAWIVITSIIIQAMIKASPFRAPFELFHVSPPQFLH